MDISYRSWLTTGIAIVTAAAVTFGPAVREPTPAVAPTPTVQIVARPITLTAQVQPLAVADVPNLLVDWLERIVLPPSASQPFPTPDFPPVVGGTGIDSTIKNIYNAIEPWVQYGFELATYAVGWIPYVGWLSGQIMIFYHFGERIVRSITFNIADWLGGNVSFVQGLINVGVDTVNSFIQLGIDEWNFWLPPLPPLPPFFPFTATTTATTEELTTLAVEDTTPVDEKHSAVQGAEVGDVLGDEGTVTVTEEDTVKAPQEPTEPEVPQQPTEPEAPQQPKKPSALNGVATQTQEATKSNEDSTVSTKAPANDKKADKGPKAGTDSAASPKKDDTGKKDSE